MQSLSRRLLFRTVDSVFVGALLHFAQSAAARSTLEWNEFAETVRRTAQNEMHWWYWDQKQYVKSIARVAERLNIDNPMLKDVTAALEKRQEHPGFKDVFKDQIVQLSLIYLEPGDSIPLHDHPDMTCVTFCVEGEVAVQSYSISRGDPHSGRCMLKRTKEGVLSRGGVSTLTVKDSNIHSLQARRRSRLLDIFTPSYDSGRARRVHGYVIQDADPHAAEVNALTCC